MFASVVHFASVVQMSSGTEKAEAAKFAELWCRIFLMLRSSDAKDAEAEKIVPVKNMLQCMQSSLIVEM